MIALVVVGTMFVVLGGVLWFVDPQSRPVAVTAILFFGACAAVGGLELAGGRLSRATRARLMGAVAMLMGVGLGALALVAWQDPNAFPRAPQPVSVIIGLLGLVFFGGGGLLLLIRAGRPFGVPRR